MFVVRAGPGWQVRSPAHPSRYFADSLWGGTQKAFSQAVNYRESLSPVTAQSRPLAEKERVSKLRPTGIPGVFLAVSRRRKTLEYQLHVRVGGLPTRSIYVGTSATWEGRLDAKLLVAAEARDELTKRVRQPVSPRRQPL